MVDSHAQSVIVPVQAASQSRLVDDVGHSPFIKDLIKGLVNADFLHGKVKTLDALERAVYQGPGEFLLDFRSWAILGVNVVVPQVDRTVIVNDVGEVVESLVGVADKGQHLAGMAVTADVERQLAHTLVDPLVLPHIVVGVDHVLELVGHHTQVEGAGGIGWIGINVDHFPLVALGEHPLGVLVEREVEAAHITLAGLPAILHVGQEQGDARVVIDTGLALETEGTRVEGINHLVDLFADFCQGFFSDLLAVFHVDIHVFAHYAKRGRNLDELLPAPAESYGPESFFLSFPVGKYGPGSSQLAFGAQILRV